MGKTNDAIVNDTHVQRRVAIRVLTIGVGTFGDQQSSRFFLLQDGGKRQGIFAEVTKAIVVRVRIDFWTLLGKVVFATRKGKDRFRFVSFRFPTGWISDLRDRRIFRSTAA